MIFVGSWFFLILVFLLLLAGGIAALVVMASNSGRKPGSSQGSMLPNRDERVSNLRQRGERYKEERERILGMVESHTISSHEADLLFHSLERETTISACPVCGGDIRAEAVKCKHCKHWLVDEYFQPRKLTKSRKDRMIAGVCGGIAEYCNADPVMVRLLAVALLVLSAFVTGLIAYIIAAMIMPEPE